MKITMMANKYSGRYLVFRAVEAIAHQWAEENPGARSSNATLRNEATGSEGSVILEATPNGKLTDASIAELRRSKRYQDEGKRFDGERVYTFRIRAAVEVRQ
jgi:hypothetical protein